MKRARAASTQEMTTSQSSARSKRVAKRSQTFGVPRWAGRTRTGFPKELRIRHRYVDTFTMTSTAGALSNQTYSCNGMFDPDFTASGHQPLYFDQLTAIYNHYTVLSSKITVRCTQQGGTSPSIHAVVYINDDTTTVGSTLYSRMEQNSAVYGTILPDGNSTLTLSKKWKASENFGPSVIGDPNLQGTAAANPTEQQFWTLTIGSADGSSTGGFYATVTIEYEAVWQELKDIATS